MKKIGLLISTMNSGGAERVVSRLSKLLSVEYDIFVIVYEDTYMCYECFGKFINMGIKSTKSNLFKKLLLPFIRAKKLRNIKTDFKLDAVISFMDSPNITNIIANVRGCKNILSVRNYSNKEKNISFILKIIDFIMKNLYKRADSIVPVSKVIGESLIKDYKVDPFKIHTVYNPYDIDNIEAISDENIEYEHMQFMKGGKVFISVGRQMYQKGFWHLIKAFRLVKSKNVQAKLVIIGKDEQGGLLQKLINELGLNDSVLLTGYQRNPFKYMKNSDIYVLSSMFEGFPNSMAEALVCGLPVIAADCKSGPREILYDNPDINKEAQDIEKADYGLLIPELNPIECWNKDITDDSDKILAEAMDMLMNDEKLIKLYASRAVERAEDFNYENCKKGFMEVIER